MSCLTHALIECHEIIGLVFGARDPFNTIKDLKHDIIGDDIPSTSQRLLGDYQFAILHQLSFHPSP
jgi:hypothetical protein